MVTSSAVVGSSAMSSRGRIASAIAMTARWRMPPEYSWGYARADPGRVGQLDAGQQLEAPASLRIRAGHAVRGHRLRDLVADAHERVERGHRVLVDHREPIAAQPPHLRPPGSVVELPALEADGPAVDGERRRSRRMTASIVSDLPEPLSPTTPTRLARAPRRGRCRGRSPGHRARPARRRPSGRGPRAAGRRPVDRRPPGRASPGGATPGAGRAAARRAAPAARNGPAPGMMAPRMRASRAPGAAGDGAAAAHAHVCHPMSANRIASLVSVGAPKSLDEPDVDPRAPPRAACPSASGCRSRPRSRPACPRRCERPRPPRSGRSAP